MKNIHVLLTDKWSRLLLSKKKKGNLQFLKDNSSTNPNNHFVGNYQNIYITNDKEIKEGDWCIMTNDFGDIYLIRIISLKCIGGNEIRVLLSLNGRENTSLKDSCKKIILTTDQELIKDGVQAIDDEFLEWFVKNSSCESVEVANDLKYFNVDELRERHLKGLPHLYSESIGYKIIIPSEKPKQVDEKGKPLTYWGGLEDVNNQETIEEAAKKQWGNVHRTGVLGFIGDYWFKKFQQEQDKKMYSEEEVLDILFELSCNNDTDKEEVEEWFEQFKKK
jgi:hypothetical protein